MTTREMQLGKGGRLSSQAASAIVRKAGQFGSSVLINTAGKTVNAKSVMGMVSLGELRGTLRLTADGKDEDRAIEAIEEALREALGI